MKARKVLAVVMALSVVTPNVLLNEGCTQKQHSNPITSTAPTNDEQVVGEDLQHLQLSADSINALGRAAYEVEVSEDSRRQPQAAAANACISLNVPYYSQRDPNWRWDKLGYSTTSTIDRYGCHLTCISMLYAYWGVWNMNPRQLNNWAKSQGAFSGDLIIASKAIQYNACRAVKYIGSGEVYTYLANRKPVVAQTSQYGGHFVLITGFDGYRFWVKDPYQTDWTTQNQPLSGTVYSFRVYGA